MEMKQIRHSKLPITLISDDHLTTDFLKAIQIQMNEYSWDDWIDENTLEELYFNLLGEKKYAYAFTDCFLEGEAQGRRKKIFNLFEQMFINQIPYSIFIPRKVFIENGFYDEKMQLGYEDWEFNIRLAKNGLFPQRIKQPLFHYRVTKNGMLIKLNCTSK